MRPKGHEGGGAREQYREACAELTGEGRVGGARGHHQVVHSLALEYPKHSLLVCTAAPLPRLGCVVCVSSLASRATAGWPACHLRGWPFNRSWSNRRWLEKSGERIRMHITKYSTFLKGTDTRWPNRGGQCSHRMASHVCHHERYLLACSEPSTCLAAPASACLGGGCHGPALPLELTRRWRDPRCHTLVSNATRS
jgi:hypothetical protein